MRSVGPQKRSLIKLARPDPSRPHENARERMDLVVSVREHHPVPCPVWFRTLVDCKICLSDEVDLRRVGATCRVGGLVIRRRLPRLRMTISRARSSCPFD